MSNAQLQFRMDLAWEYYKYLKYTKLYLYMTTWSAF